MSGVHRVSVHLTGSNCSSMPCTCFPLPIRHSALTDSSCYLKLAHSTTHRRPCARDARTLWCTSAACLQTVKRTPPCNRCRILQCPPEGPAETTTQVSAHPAPPSCGPATMTYRLLHTCMHQGTVLHDTPTRPQHMPCRIRVSGPFLTGKWLSSTDTRSTLPRKP